MLEITLYTKENCSLCLKAKRVLQEVQRRRPFRLREVDITTSEALYERYKNDIPVATVNDEQLFRHRVEASTLEQSLIERSNTV
jgi:glutaredoxin